VGFCISSQVSNPHFEEPSARYHVLAAAFTPTEEWPSGDGAPRPVQVIRRSTAIVFPSLQLTLVEKSVAPMSSAGLIAVCDMGGRLISGLLRAPDLVM
jgi:hypothetical protein